MDDTDSPTSIHLWLGPFLAGWAVGQPQFITEIQVKLPRSGGVSRVFLTPGCSSRASNWMIGSPAGRSANAAPAVAGQGSPKLPQRSVDDDLRELEAPLSRLFKANMIVIIVPYSRECNRMIVHPHLPNIV